MASSSTSSIPKTNFKYDVFLSFRGDDTRNNFVDHLYDALKRKNIETYKDDKNLEKGKKISKELLEAIEESRFHIIVFSKNYASSSWCLDELVKIMECQKTQTGQTAYPIFYDVEPTEVRKQSGAFGEAFDKCKKEEYEGKWRKALEDATSFNGWDLRATADGHEVEFIKIVVKDISSKLPTVTAEENLIGMTTRINRVVSALNVFPDEFCMIGIAGMGGSGKTTLSRAVFDQIRNEFEGISFVENVREVSKPNFSGLKKLQNQVLRDVLNDQGIIVTGVLEGKTMMKKMMSGRKVLVVLDDVDHIDQLKALAGEPNWFKPGSKIIITTRDKQVLLAHKVNSILDVDLLTDEEAICLLSRCAFGTWSPIPTYEELSLLVVRYAAGLPLTITILGSSLCDANEDVWIDTLKRLEKIPLDETLQKLELSYMGLNSDCKEIFLDVACIYRGWQEDAAIRALESRGFHAIRGLSVLEKKSLITISRYGCLDMHDHIQEMGRYVVRSLHPDEPNKHSRLWIGEEIENILANNQGTEVICMKFCVAQMMNLKTIMKGLGKMEKLRLLLVYGYDFSRDWKLVDVGQYFPNTLQYLSFEGYSFCSLPKTFQACNLVFLQMRSSKMKQLWKGGERKVLHKLRFLDISYSLLKTFDLGLTPNLEMLDLGGCHGLVELHIHVQCPQLESLILSGTKLSTLDLRLAPNIEILNLGGCESLEELEMPRKCPQLKSLNLKCPKLRFFNCEPTLNIKKLKLKEYANLIKVDMFLECPQLESLDLEISMLRTLDLGPTPNLKTLKLHGCYNLVKLRMYDEYCKLKTLSLGCPQLRTFDLGLTLNLEAFTFYVHDALVELLISFRCPQLEYLKIINSKLRTLELTFNNLKTLILEDCGLVELHISDGDVKLESLDIKRCSELKTLDLRQTPNLESLCLLECYRFVKLHAPVGGLKKLTHIKAQGLLRFRKFKILNTSGLLPELYLRGMLVDICPLHHNNNLPKFRFECSYKEDLPSLIGNVDKLISVGFSCACTDFESFFGSICSLQHLTKLTLEGSIPQTLKDLDQLQCLEQLTLMYTEMKHLPDSICMLKRLKMLELSGCKLLEKLPEDLGRLECLETLNLKWCTVLRDIPNSICRLKSLEYIVLRSCCRVKELPWELGCLECLKYLDIRGTCINNLPPSILLLEGLQIIQSEDETSTTTSTTTTTEVCCCTVL